ncbi:MAG: L-seryl-tRNA(Sec) selenium transferase, partial [Syntrophales bacterium]|nr:L-seryl-tRNA(Sec) selenium transferase [Syntrophales bacterium]
QNLGRAPLCDEAVDAMVSVARGYSNLEYNLEKGERGLRYDHVRRLLCVLTGAEDALVVNNNAAAVLLVLNALAEGKEAIVSRGELIEIGGEFRIPEVMEKSGARLREVGTTNRTRLDDYEQAIGMETGLILKVHPSNYRIVGFTEDVALGALVALGKKRGIPVVIDLGSGCFTDLTPHGLPKEPTVPETVATGVDVVTFSGDKLLGGPQAGLILGKAAIMAKVMKNPLNRALRIDKLTLAALEGTLRQYLHPQRAASRLQVLRAIGEPLPAVMKRARRLRTILRAALPPTFTVEVAREVAATGGGSLPGEQIPTAVVTVRSGRWSPSRLAEALRQCEPPVIVRIADDHVMLDLRTVRNDEYAIVRDALVRVAGADGPQR